MLIFTFEAFIQHEVQFRLLCHFGKICSRKKCLIDRRSNVNRFSKMTRGAEQLLFKK